MTHYCIFLLFDLLQTWSLLDLYNHISPHKNLIKLSAFTALRIFNTPHFQHSAFSTLCIFNTPHFQHSAFSTLRIFNTPHFPHSAFPHSAFSTLRIFHTPHFQYSALSTLRIFNTPGLRTPGLRIFMQTFFDNFMRQIRQSFPVSVLFVPDSVVSVSVLYRDPLKPETSRT